MPGESTLRKNFQQLQEGEGRRTPNPLYNAQPAFFGGDNNAAAVPRSSQPVAAPRGSHLAVQPSRQQQKPRQPAGHLQVITHTHTFNSPLSRTTRVSRYQKGKANLDFTGARDSEWQWHQLGHMQVCTSLQTDNHASTPPLSFYSPDALPAAQPTASKH